MADYTKLTSDVITTLLSRYQIGDIRSILPMDGGQANSSLKIMTGSGEYTLAVCDEKNLDEIRCLTNVLTYLETCGFPSTPLVRTRNNNPYILHDGKPVYIKQFLPGQVSPSLSCDMLFQVGKTIAALHALEPPPGLPKDFPYGINTFQEIIDSGISHPYVDWLKNKKEFLLTAIDPDMPRGFIHGDIFWDNLVFSNDTLIALIDFEEACHYYKLYDIGICAAGCCSRDGRILMDRVASLLSGYQQLCPLTGPEKRQLKIFMEYAAVAASFWRFRQYNIRRPSEASKDTYLELSSVADQIHAMDTGIFDRL